MPAARNTTSISSGFDDDAIASGQRSADPPHRVDRAGNQRRPVRVALEHSLDHLGVDLLRRPRDAERVGHVARPLGRAHPHHVARRALGERPAGLAGEPDPHLVPHLLGVDDHTVEVEDDRVDHSAR